MKKTLSLWTLLGFLFGFGLFGVAIVKSTNNYIMFVSINSLIMVLGGTVAATMISYHSRYVLKTFYHIVMILIPYHVSSKSLANDVKQIITWARLHQKEGAKSMDQLRKSKLGKDPFLKFGFEMLSAGYKGEALRKNLENMMNSCFHRELVQANIANTMASFAPAFGMVGTLIGLIIMLDNMGGDIAKVGPGLAVALLTTLYGVVLAQMIFKPVAEKIQQTYEMVRYRNLLVLEGLMLISEGKNAFEIQDSLNSFLDPAHQIDLSKENTKKG